MGGGDHYLGAQRKGTWTQCTVTNAANTATNSQGVFMHAYECIARTLALQRGAGFM